MKRGIKLVSDGTDNHLVLANVKSFDMNGKKAQDCLDAAGITTSKSTVPFDEEKPWFGSGVRIGTPALTTRGMAENEMRIIGELIHRVLANPEDEATRAAVSGVVKELCEQFPLYG